MSKVKVVVINGQEVIVKVVRPSNRKYGLSLTKSPKTKSSYPALYMAKERGLKE